MKPQQFETEFAGKKLSVEIGTLAKQASGSCTVRYGDTVVLATAVMGGIREGINYFPLSVDYEERLYAAGKIKGSRWVKREGRPSDEAILTSRLVDRAIRPLFPKEIKNEVQVILTVLSFDNENDSDVVGLVAGSIALSISPIPWSGPLAGLRVGRVEGEWLVNPSFEAREKSDLDLVIAGINHKVLMIEAEGKEVTEDDVYAAIEFSTQHISTLIDFINDVTKKVGQPKTILTTTPEAESEEGTDSTASSRELIEKSQAWIQQHVGKILFDTKLVTKAERKAAIEAAKQELLTYLESEGIGKERRVKALPLVDEFVDSEVSKAIITQEKRVDGRALTDVRLLECRVGILPRTHGSGLFNRGETQVLSIVTLGAPGDEQFLEGLEESGRKRYMHHYNFPPYSVGEVGRLGSPGRREIGHGALAEKALRPILPEKEEFPYTIRVVSEVLGSNGSSSMASTCGSSLALMDAGVPIKKAVAGIAMGLASDEAGNYKVLTDLQDHEDGTGGMDFKIAGTRDGITAIQLDTKTHGLPLEIIKQTLTQGHQARQEVLDSMDKAIKEVRKELSVYAPRIITFKIDPEKIRSVIGPGGKVINEIIDKTGVQIDIEQDGTVAVTATSEESSQAAVAWIQSIVKEFEVGEAVEGTVSRIMDFGAIVDISPTQDGMVHISEIAHRRVTTVADELKVGDKVNVKVISKENGRLSLSIKALLPRPEGMPEPEPRRDFRPRHGGDSRRDSHRHGR